MAPIHSPEYVGHAYAPGSREALELVTGRLRELLDRLATSRAVGEGRVLVTAEDVMHCVEAAFEEMADELAAATDGR